MNYAYLILVVAGLALSITGFVRNGKTEGTSLGRLFSFFLA